MKHILDITGLLLKRFHGAADNSVETEDGTTMSCWQAAFIDFLDQHLLPLLSSSAAPRDIIAVWDSGNTYRLNVWPDYKKKRLTQERDETLTRETKRLKQETNDFLAAIGARQCWVRGEEADDVIALLCKNLQEPKIVHTVDMDLLALVNEDTSVVRSGVFHGNNSRFDPPYPLVSLKKALVGDSSDGYVGVSGFGPKAWENLYALWDGHMGWLQAVIDMDRPELLEPYLQDSKEIKLLYNKWPETRRGWQLACLHPEACYGSYRDSAGKTKPKRPEWKIRLPNRAAAVSVISDALKQITTEVSFDAALEVYTEVLDRFFPWEELIECTAKGRERLPKLLQEIVTSPIVAYDFESSDKLKWAPFRQAADKNYVDVLAQELAGISINWGDNLQKTIYIPFDHKDTHNFSKDWAAWILQTLSSREERPVVHNASFELTVAARNLGYMPTAPYDTSIMASYVDENEESRLKDLSHRLLNYRQTSYAEVTQGRDMCDMAAHEVVHYGCDDSLTTAHLFDLFRMIMQLEGSWDFYTANEVDPAVDDAWNFIEGVTVDFQRLTELREESRVRAEQAEKEIRQALSKNVNEQSAATTQQAAETLLQEWWLTDQFKFIKDGVYDAEAGTDHYNRLWGRAYNACFYEPMTATEDKKQFSPTLLGINGVIKAIDAEAPTLTKLTQDALYHYGKGLTAYIDTAVKQPRTAVELNELYSLLFNAKKNLGAGKRQGNAYETFHAFCQSVLDERIKGKVQVSGTTLNFGSQPQMQQMLYGMLRLPVRRRSKPTEGSLREQQRLEGSPATGIKAVASALVWDVREGDWRRPVLENYGSVCKERQLESLYFNKYPLWQHPEDGKIHPQIRNCGTATRRPSGSNPNMLQVKSGDMRSVFVVPEGHLYVSLDYAGQELVLTACAARDPVMLDAFSQTPRKDVHSLTASGIAPVLLPRLGVPWSGPMSYEQFLEGLHSEDKTIREAYKVVRNRYGKSCNFGVVYGSSAIGLAENLMIAKEEAEIVFSAFTNLYKRIPEWQSEVASFARERGYVEMPFGSRRHAIADLWSDDRKLYGRQERQLSNACIQSGAAEILKVTRQRMFERNMRERYKLTQVFPIYDEVAAVVPTDLVEDYIMEMAEIMRITPPGYPVGMEVDAKFGKTWGTQKEIGVPTRERIREVLGEL